MNYILRMERFALEHSRVHLTEAEIFEFRNIENRTPTITRSAVAKMKQNELITAILHRENSFTKEYLQTLKTSDLRNILNKHAVMKRASSKKRKLD